MKVPQTYLLDQLAQRYGVGPEEVETWRVDTILRSLEFMRIESSSVTKRTGVKEGPPR